MIHLKKSKDNMFYFIVVAVNGETLATSEIYTTKQHCFNGINALIHTITHESLIVKDDTI